VQAGSPTERSGVRAADVVLQVDGVDVKTIAEVTRSLAGKFAGDPVTLKIRREGWSGEVRLVLGARPE
jgi:S1-C subfamily serine protease